MTNYQMAKKCADEIDDLIIDRLKSGQSFRVEAGAGSGKTYSLHKVVDWINMNLAYNFHNKHRQVACITYTNAAVDVIKSRILNCNFIFPSTIHSFAWDNIKIFQSSLITGVKELDLLPRDTDISVINKVIYDFGVRDIQDGGLHLFHEDVIKLFAWFLDKQKFRMILADKYPIILIDEYQDSSKIIMDKFIEYFIDKELKPQFGLFGDAWQSIYLDQKACGLVTNDKLIEIKKETNFRSQPIIVEVLNRIRPELPQLSASDEHEGSVVVITTANEEMKRREKWGYYKGDLNEATREEYINFIKDKLRSKGWNWDDGSSKILMITHRALAIQQNYQTLLKILDNKFKQQEDIHFIFFRDVIEPLYTALENQDVKNMYDVLGTARRPVENKSQKHQWQELKQALQVARQKNIYDVLKTICNSNLIPIPKEIMNNIEEYETGNKPNYAKATLQEFYMIKYEEIINAINFFKPDATYSTDHGVKGEEYDNVLLIIGREWNRYQFDKLLYKNEKDLTQEEQTAYIRNRNLFYVCCSRARKRLAIFITIEINDEFERYLQNVFGANNIMTYKQFMGRPQKKGSDLV